MMRRDVKYLIVAVALIVSAIVLQTVFIARLNLPGAGPDLLILAVMAIGLTSSANYGAVAGFITGLLADVVPPDETLLGVTAVVLTLVGFVSGSIRDPRGMAPVQLLAYLFTTTFLAQSLYAISATFLEARVVEYSEALLTVVAISCYTTGVGLLILPQLLPAMARLRQDSSRRVSLTDPISLPESS